MSNSKLQVLVDKRKAILLVEMVALLHDIGKLSSQFLDQMSLTPSNHSAGFEHENAVERVNGFVDAQFLSALKSSKLRNLLRWNSISKQEQIGQLLDMILHHDKGKHSAFLVRLLNRCDGVDSGADKGTTRAEDLPKEAKQPFNKTFVSTAFGAEPKLIVPKTLDDTRLRLTQELGSSLPKMLDPSLFSETRLEILQSIRSAYLNGLGETRRSANDVTLWDHSFSVATLYKTSLATFLMTGTLDIGQLRWRLLRVNFDVLGLYARALKIADLLGYQEAVHKACDAIKHLIEDEYPLGNEIYRDTTGIYFTFPDIDLIAELNQEIRCRIEEIEPELVPRIQVGQTKG